MDVIVVVGYHDESKIKSVYKDAFCVVTNGSEISVETINFIKELSKNNRIIIFTDPDYPGERIRNIIANEVSNVSHAFLNKKDCISKNNKKVGIEHASSEAIIEALSKIYKEDKIKNNITNQDLFALGLNGNVNSHILREKISDKLNIGNPNAKLFLKRINLLGLTKEELEDLICQVK